ncbi:cell division protein ZapA [Rhodobacteraceae bacterium WD3A24]|nr:cell division protein ZapA [Rhodobacteraceae bacterium WD3A24]
MAEETVTIGGKEFRVACQAGEEEYLRAAATMLDAEAQTLREQIGRVPEARMLLMAGLMLADKTANMEDQLREAQNKLAEAEAELARLRAQPAPAPEKVEVPVVPTELRDMLAEVAARAEALADRVDDAARTE